MTKYSLATKRSHDSPNGPHQASEAGQALVFIIIVIAVIGAGLFFLNSMEFRQGKYDTGFVERLMSSDNFELIATPGRLHE